LLELFVSDDCRWPDHDAYQRLAYVNFEALLQAPVVGTKRRVWQQVLAAQGQVANFAVTLAMVGSEVKLSIAGGSSIQVAEISQAAIASWAQELRVAARRVVRLDGDVTPELQYRVQLLLADLLRPAEIIDHQNTVLPTG
jgi:hypothetical protein